MKNIPIWTEREIEDRAIKIMDFLVQMHPFLEKGSPRRDCVELRPIYRGPKEEKEYIRSATIWNKKGSMDALKGFLRKINGKPIDAYFSVYAFNFDIEARKADGKKFEKGKVNNQNVQFTQIIPMDFDNISFEDFYKQIKKLASAGIKVTSVFSGNGYQGHILLNKPCEDKNLLAKMTRLLLQKGFPVDEKITDAARVMRLPYTNNYKAFDHSSNSHTSNPQAVPTEIVSSVDVRYSLEDVFYAVSSLPDCQRAGNYSDQISVISYSTVPQITNMDEAKYEYESLIRWGRLPSNIQRMLDCTREGLRNKVLFFLIPYFRNTQKMDFETINSVMSVWAKRCHPILDAEYVKSEVNRIYGYNFPGPWGKYTEEMTREFGEMKFIDKRNNSMIVKIPNGFIDVFPEISDTAVKIYLSMLEEEEQREDDSWSIQEISSFVGASVDSILRNIKGLVKSGYIDKRRSYKRSGMSYEYFVSRFIRTDKGFLIFERTRYKEIMKKLLPSELKLFMLICQIIEISNQSCFASQNFLGKKIGKSQCSISRITESLVKKEFLKKVTESNGIKKHCRYELLF